MSKRIDNERFIESIGKHPCLYNKLLLDFKDTPKKRTIWTAIGIQFGISAGEAEKRWKNQRDRYRKEKKKFKASLDSGSGSSEVYKPKWGLYEQIDTILCALSTEEECSIGNIPVLELNDDAPEYNNVITHVDSDDICDISTDESGIQMQNTDAPSLCKEKPQKRSFVSTNLFLLPKKEKGDSILTESLETCKNTSNHLVTENQQDRIDHFCNGLNVRLKDLPAKDRLKAMKEIEMYMFGIEENQLE